jgi:hypothetical protein
MTGTGFNLVGELENRGDGDERSMVMVVELKWIKIRIRYKIRVFFEK